jgi:hypothetical protein
MSRARSFVAGRRVTRSWTAVSRARPVPRKAGKQRAGAAAPRVVEHRSSLKVATDGCLCIAEEARLCELDAGVLGVQICEVITSKPASTGWSDCLPLNESE